MLFKRSAHDGLRPPCVHGLHLFPETVNDLLYLVWVVDVIEAERALLGGRGYLSSAGVKQRCQQTGFLDLHALDLVNGRLTCAYAELGLGILAPEPVVVLTTASAFSGLLTNVATVTLQGEAVDANPSNNTSETISVMIAQEAPFVIYLPLATGNSATPTH